jgi:ribosome-associated protein
MDENISRSEKKRRFKGVENLVQELLNLSAKGIRALPCDDVIKEEIEAARGLKAGALKRQSKYIAKVLRQDVDTVEKLLSYMEDAKGSKLKEAGELHELERLRDNIINEALAIDDDDMEGGKRTHPSMHRRNNYHEGSIDEVVKTLPGLSAPDLKRAAIRYAQTRQPRYSREIFRMLKSALDRQKYEEGT